MSLYSRHKIERVEKPFARKDSLYWLFAFDHVDLRDSERWFWYKGVHKRLREVYWMRRRRIWRDVAKAMVVQIYNSSPLILSLIDDAKTDQHQTDAQDD